MDYELSIVLKLIYICVNFVLLKVCLFCNAANMAYDLPVVLKLLY
jgi:hypothetical protein